jgi:hypothetical protein
MPFVGNGEICALNVGLDVGSLRVESSSKLRKRSKRIELPLLGQFYPFSYPLTCGNETERAGGECAACYVHPVSSISSGVRERSQDLLTPPALPLWGKCLFWRALLASPLGPPLGASGISSPSEPYRSAMELRGAARGGRCRGREAARGVGWPRAGRRAGGRTRLIPLNNSTR